MPMIVTQVTTLKTPEAMQNNLRTHLLRSGLPNYSYKEQRSGFEVWHAQNNEGETQIFWHTFDREDEPSERDGLERCAAALQEYYWVQLYVPNRLRLMYGRMHLRVLHGLHWLK